MNPNVFGTTITRLRKRSGYTQAELADKLHLSDKTISKWENGLGYPDITQLPALARVFGVTVDYLLSEQNSGIVIAGTILADVVKNIDDYPKIGMLSNISSAARAVGGCAPNTAIDLASIDRALPVSVIGRVGDDDNGRFLLSKMQTSGVNVSGVIPTTSAQTSFSDVMSLPTGERTFFSYKGANSLFSPEDVDVDSLGCKMLHIGYILLLDKFDAPDEEYGTVMARFLRSVQKKGIKTSIDMVSSNNTDEYPRIVKPAFAYSDYVIINEIECCGAWGLSPHREDGSANEENIRLAMEKTMACGVGEKVIVHTKEAGYCLDKSGKFTRVGSLVLPAEQIKGCVGAGDAFCAGCLYAIYHEYTDEQTLEFANASAACSLSSENAVDGMKPKAEIEKIAKTYPKRA